jgi:hypothetical protein
MCYNLIIIVLVTQGWLAHSRGKGVLPVSVFETLMFAVAFTALIVSILSANHKK